MMPGFECRTRERTTSFGDKIYEEQWINLDMIKMVHNKEIHFADKCSYFVECSGLSETEKTDRRLFQMAMEGIFQRFKKKDFLILSLLNQKYEAVRNAKKKDEEEVSINKWWIEVVHPDNVDPRTCVQGCEKY